MKLTTIILETLSYIAQVFAIVFLFLSFDSANVLVGILTFVALWVVGFALYRTERLLEKKREMPVVHYDYIILIVIGWLMIAVALVELFTPKIAETQTTFAFAQIIWSLYLIGSGIFRRSLYKKEDEQFENSSEE